MDVSYRYKRYVNFDRKSNPQYNLGSCVKLTVASAFTIDSTIDVIPPTVTKPSKEIYLDYVLRSCGARIPPSSSLTMYQKYVNFSL